MKKLGFLSFGHWTPAPQSQARSAADVLLQSIDLAVEAERLGLDGAYFRVPHFARQLASPFPLLAAIGARTRKIEIGTAVIDMRYENPHYMAEDASAADLIAGSRLQLGISRGSPEQVVDGWRHFGYRPADGEDDAAMGRRHAQVFLELLVELLDSREHIFSDFRDHVHDRIDDLRDIILHRRPQDHRRFLGL
jgi:alkanesulfonate monooxygenase SsuD/methylene tetrahydromethanopterin reductase-like flavin-dependent oxidoreductase (luciferase family)